VTSGLPKRCPRWLTVALVTAISAIGCLTGASVAQATITGSNVTSPTDGTALLYNGETAPNATFTVSGMTNGTDGDAVDIVCANDGSYSSFAEYKGTGGNGVAVAADGSFTATVPLVDLAGGAGCELLALPHDDRSYAGPAYTGPRIAFSVFDPVTIGGRGPNAGDTYGFEFSDSTLSSVAGIESIDGCGESELLYDGSAAMNQSPVLLDCAGTLHGSDFDFLNGEGTPDLTRSEIEVDGENAYGSLSAYYLIYDENDGSVPDPGFPPLTATLDSDNPSTGAAQTTETESLVECSPSDAFDPSATECSSFVPSGVSVTRVTDFSDDGGVTTVTDTYTSTDGNAHTLDLQYETDLNGGYLSGWELPGQTSFTEHATGDAAGAPASAPGTIYAIYQTTRAPSFTNPVAEMTFANPYSSITFDDTLLGGHDSALIDYQPTVPAGGSASISWSYATGDSLAAVEADAAAAQTAYGGGSPPPPTAPPPVTTPPVTTPPVTTSTPGTTVKTTPSQTFTTLAALKRLTVKVSPHHATRAPYRYKLSGTLTLPQGLSKSQGCKGTVTVLVQHGAKKLASHSVNVTKKCTYSRTVSFSARQLKGHGTLSFAVTFNGNSELAARTAKAVTARFG
jgi:hypothetical protein